MYLPISNYIFWLHFSALQYFHSVAPLCWETNAYCVRYHTFQLRVDSKSFPNMTEQVRFLAIVLAR